MLDVYGNISNKELIECYKEILELEKTGLISKNGICKKYEDNLKHKLCKGYGYSYVEWNIKNITSIMAERWFETNKDVI